MKISSLLDTVKPKDGRAQCMGDASSLVLASRRLLFD